MNQDNSNASDPNSNNNLLNYQLVQLLAATGNRTAADSQTDASALIAAVLRQSRESTLPCVVSTAAAASSSMDLESSQALLKHHEDKLRATRLLLQQQEQEGNMQRDPILLASSAMAEAKAAQASILGGLATTRRGSGTDQKVASLVARQSLNGSSNHEDLQAAASAEDDGSAKTESDEEKSLDLDNDEGYDDKMSDDEYFENFSTTDDNRVIQETFPLKLYRMLHEVEKTGKQNIISFLPHGRSFVVHKPKAFVEDVMPKYFTTCRLASFQRQLNLYGFRRITEGREKGAYTHDFFLKGKRALCRKVKRQKTRVGKAVPAAPTAQPSCGASSTQAAVAAAIQASSVPGLLATAPSPAASLQFGTAAAQVLLGRLSGSTARANDGGDIGYTVLQEALRRGLLADVNSARQQDNAVSAFLASQQLQNQLQQQEAERILLQHLRQQQKQDPNARRA